MTGWWAVAFVVQWVLLVALLVVVVALARQVGTLHLRLGPLGALEMDDEGPPLGEMVPAQSATDPAGRTVGLGGPADAGRVAMFVSPTCPICAQVQPGLPAAARAAGRDSIVVSDPGAEQRLSIPGTPFVLVMDAGGVLRAKGTVNNLEQLEGLIDTAERREAEDRAPAAVEAHGAARETAVRETVAREAAARTGAGS